MNSFLRTIPFTWKNLIRRPLRTGLTVAGIAVATFLFSFVESMRDGVSKATEAGAAETRLVVYRKNRFCPFASQLPQSYQRSILNIEGVKSAVPIKIVVNNVFVWRLNLVVIFMLIVGVVISTPCLESC